MTITVHFYNAGEGSYITIYEDIKNYSIQDDFIELYAEGNQSILFLAKEQVLSMEVER